MKTIMLAVIIFGFSISSHSEQMNSRIQRINNLTVVFKDLQLKIVENINHPRAPLSTGDRTLLNYYLIESSITLSDILNSLKQNQSLDSDKIILLIQKIDISREQFKVINEEVSNTYSVNDIVQNIESILEIENDIAQDLNVPRSECKNSGIIQGNAVICRTHLH